MKKTALLIVFILVVPLFAQAQLTVVQGGTGTTSFPYGWVVMGNSQLRLSATSTANLAQLMGLSPFPFTPVAGGNATSTLLYLYNGLYALSSTTINTLTLSNALTVANGGTGAKTLTGCLTGNGTGAITGSGTCNTSSATVSSVSTSTIPTVGNLAYWTSNGSPSLLGSIATSTLYTGTTGQIPYFSASGLMGTTTLNITVGGSLGVNTTNAPLSALNPTRRYISVLGNGGMGVFDAQGNAADTDSGLLGQLVFEDSNESVPDKRSAFIFAQSSGSVVGNRGGQMLFETRSDGGAFAVERMRVANNGGVGIGTTTPGTTLSVQGQAVIANYVDASIFTATSTSASFFPYASTTALTSTGSAYFATSNGNVGIGTTTPLTTLDVTGTMGVKLAGSEFPTSLALGLPATSYVVHAGSNWGLAITRATVDTGGANLTLYHTRNTDASIKTALSSGDIIGRVNFEGASSGSTVNIPAGIAAIVNGSVSDGVLPTDLVFNTVASGDISFPSTGERMRITSAGNVGIGTTTPPSKLTVNGHIGTDGAIPTLSSAGTSPSITIGSTDTAGEITEGTVATGATITFASAYARKPFCVLSSEAGLLFSYSVSASAITIVNIGALSSTAVTFQCISNDL